MTNEEARQAWHRRKAKQYTPRPEPTETSLEPTPAAIRQEEVFEQRRGHALAVAKRRSWLKRHKIFLLKAVHGVEVKP